MISQAEEFGREINLKLSGMRYKFGMRGILRDVYRLEEVLQCDVRMNETILKLHTNHAVSENKGEERSATKFMIHVRAGESTYQSENAAYRRSGVRN